MIKFKKIILIFYLNICFLNNNLYSYQAEVKSINNREYLTNVLKVINNAEESIHMSMFVVSLRSEHKGSSVYKLCDALIDAKKRRVSVTVILDQNIDFYDKDKKVEGKNTAAYNYLKENGIEVSLDNKYTFNHSKSIVIDERIVIVGSTNWSYSAIEKNNETSVLIESAELAKELIKSFSEIKLGKPEKNLIINPGNSLAVDKTFMNNPKFAGRMITESDERAFDLYLRLLYHNKGDYKVSFDFDKYAEYLGISDMTPEAYRRQLSKSLRKLNEIYKVVDDVEFYYGKNARTKLRDINDRRKKYTYPEKDIILISKEYFQYNWDRLLTQKAKHCYLINLYMSQQGDGINWSVSELTLDDIFGLSPKTAGAGMKELKRLNIIEVVYSSIDEGPDKRRPAKYKLLGLYDPVKHEENIKKIEEEYGEKFHTALKYAKIVYKDNDLKVIEQIINLMDEFGGDLVKYAYKKVGKKAPDNPKRCQDYAVAIIKSEASERESEKK